MDKFKKPIAAFTTVAILAIVAWLLYDNYANKIKAKRVFVEKPKIIMGISTDASFEQSTEDQSKDIGDLWKKFHEDKVTNNLPNIVTDNPNFYGVYYNYKDQHKSTYSVLAGSEVSAVDEDSKYKYITLPVGQYMVFEYNFPQSGFTPEIVVNGWKDVDQFFNSHKLYKRTFTIDYEIYEQKKLKIFISYDHK